MDSAHFTQVEEAAAVVAARLPQAAQCRVLVIAGSGLGGFVRHVESAIHLPYGEIPHVGSSTVTGHSGELLAGLLPGSDEPILVMAGRRHYYEGEGAHTTAVLLKSLLHGFSGLKTVVISNAAGGLNPSFDVGDLMLISDQINWVFSNPLVGPNRDDWGPRFPDMCDCYSPRLRQLAKAVGVETQVSLREGVYAAGHGPSYETRAEVAMLRHVAGADAVGMSTVAETLVAKHMERDVLGISFISNSLVKPAVTTHEEVMENARLVESKFARVISGIVLQLQKPAP
jgi:purine-nucleoside phosphorylase